MPCDGALDLGTFQIKEFDSCLLRSSKNGLFFLVKAHAGDRRSVPWQTQEGTSPAHSPNVDQKVISSSYEHSSCATADVDAIGPAGVRHKLLEPFGGAVLVHVLAVNKRPRGIQAIFKRAGFFHDLLTG